MRQQTIPVNRPLTVLIDHVDGDLQVAGWERAEIAAKTGGDQLDLSIEGGKAFVRGSGDLILYVPRGASLQAGNVGGDADIRALEGIATLGSIGGDLHMRAVGLVTLENISGDLSLRGCASDFTAQRVGADASLRDVRGALKLGAVGGDLYLRNLAGNVEAHTGADAILYLQPKPGTNVSVRAGADILLRLPPKVDAELVLQGGSMESIRVDFPGIAPGETGNTRQVKLGSGAAAIRLTAGADLLVTCRADEWQSLVDFDLSGLDEFLPGDFPGLPADFHERIAQHVREAVQHTEHHIEAHIEAAMHSAGEKIRAADRRSNFMGVFMGRGGVGRPPASVVMPSIPPPPISDDERLAVLKMLQDKKISLEEAEKLLAALEGR